MKFTIMSLLTLTILLAVPAEAKAELNTAAENLALDLEESVTGAFDWFEEVQYIYERGDTALVTDLDTGKSFYMTRTYGTNHADVEPLTSGDTETILEIWGEFNWERRAVLVSIDNHVIAASMTAFPHAGLDGYAAEDYVSGRSGGYGYGVNLDAVKDNAIDGHMDIHFFNSRTHGTNVRQASHHDMIQKSEDFLSYRKVQDFGYVL